MPFLREALPTPSPHDPTTPRSSCRFSIFSLWAVWVTPVAPARAPARPQHWKALDENVS